MGLLQKTAERVLWKIIERRSSLENPQTPLSYPAEWLLDIFNGGRTDSGIRVSEMTALQTESVLACVNIIRSGIATLPWHVYKRELKAGRHIKHVAHDHPLYDLLHLVPNEEMTSHTYRSTLQAHMLLWGNGYAEIQRDKGNRIVGLWPRNPARTRPVRLTANARIQGTVYPRGTLVYHTSETMGDEISAVDDSANRMAPERIILAEDMIHMLGLSLDGRLGQSTVYLARQIIGLDLAAEKHAAKLFGNGAVPRGILTYPGTMMPPALETLKRSWAEAHGGENVHKVAVLEAGLKFEPIGMDAEKAQLIDVRKFQRTAIAALFQVPPHMLGEAEKAKSNVEQTSIEFLNYCLNPWINVWEQEAVRKLFLSGPQSGNYVCKMETHKLLYPDADGRSKFYTAMRSGGWGNANDIREFEDMNPIPGKVGEVFWAPVNVVDASTGLIVGQDPNDPALNPPAAPGKGNPPGAKGKPGVEKPQGGAPQNKGVKPTPKKVPSVKKKKSRCLRYERIYLGMFRDAFGRLFAREKVDTSTFVRCFKPTLYALVGSLSEELAAETLGPSARSLCAHCENEEAWHGENEAGHTFEVRPPESLAAVEFDGAITAYLDGMRGTLNGTDVNTPELQQTHIVAELRRAVETLEDLVDRRYNPNHADQPRHPDGTWHDGTLPFFIGRHGTTDDDLANKWSGHSGISINDQGKLEADVAAVHLRDVGIRRIISSTLPRSVDTAQRIANGLLVPLTLDPRLNAWDLGIFAGMDESENADRLKLYIDNPDDPVPEGKSLNDYRQRVREALDEARASNDSTGPILALTHSSAISLYLSDGSVDGATSMISPGGVVRLDGKKVRVVCGEMHAKVTS